MKRMLGLICVAITAALLLHGGPIGCGGGGGQASNNSGGGGNTGGSKSWAEAGSALTIDTIVNGLGSGSALTMKDKSVTTSITAPFYFGRFLFTDGVHLFTGSIKFKIVKQDDSSAYFTNFSLEHMSVVTGYESHSDIVSSETDLSVNPAFNSVSNHIEIADATKRFVSFDIDFGNNDFFGDVSNAGVMFSSDFTTMAGGDNSTFFFIAQKADSQPDVSLSNILGDFGVVNFIVNASGNVILEGSSTVSVGGVGGNGFTAFVGSGSGGSYDGELALTDSSSGSFLFGLGSGDGTAKALGVNGAFLISADTTLALGIDAVNGSYFAAERITH